jgi:PIN domain nuclease of toxin-antitoxin system
MLAEPERLRSEVKELLAQPDNRIFLSAASSWEIAIKQALGRLALPAPAARYVPERMEATGVEGLAIEHVHALRVSGLPPHHRDPFDRLLVAQAQIERMPLVTADPLLEPYSVELIWAGSGPA